MSFDAYMAINGRGLIVIKRFCEIWRWLSLAMSKADDSYIVIAIIRRVGNSRENGLFYISCFILLSLLHNIGIINLFF